MSQDISQINAPKFDLKSIGTKIKSVSFTALTGSGIQKNIPVLNMEQHFVIKENRENLTEPSAITDETFVDLLGQEVIFSDNSKIKVDTEEIVIDIQELNCFTGLENFKLNIYEMVTESDGTKRLIKFESLEEISSLFEIITDQDVEKIKDQNLKSTNFYKRGEEK